MKIKNISFLLVIALSFSHLSSTVATLGDTQGYTKTNNLIIPQLMKFNPTAVFHTGDMSPQGLRQSEYDQFFSIIKPITDHSRFYPVMGNHERNRELYFANFPELKGLTYYTATEDSMVFIILDSNMKLGPGSPQYKWLQATLEQHKQQPMILLMHHPIFSSGEHGDALGLSLFLPALLSNYPVLSSFCGHDHMYERSEYNGHYYVVSGGAGGSLYRADSRNDYSKKIFLGHNFCILNYKNAVLNVKAYDIDGKQIDEFNAEFKPQTKSAETEQ